MTISILPSPVGPLVLEVRYGAITKLEFHHTDDLLSEGQDSTSPIQDAASLIQDAILQLDQYFSGSRKEFDLPLSGHGTPFQQKVWEALRKIPYGTTATYGQIATAIGQPKAARAVGMANNRNPISILIPCHRVIGADGSLVGYGGGIPIKKQLLELEGLTR